MAALLERIGNGLFGAVEAAIRTVDPIHPRDPALARLFGFGKSSNAGVRVDHESFHGIPAVYRGINILSNAVARVPFYVFKVDASDQSKTWATGHTSWKCVSVKPSPELKQFDFRKTMTAWAIGWGNAVAHIHRPRWPFGGPVELTPLLPDRTFPVRISRDMVKKYDISENLEGVLYYETRINDQTFAFPADNCLHIRGLGGNPYWGYDIVHLMLQAIGGAQARADFGYRFYGQGANPAGFVEIPGGLSEEAEKRFVESMRRGLEGMGKSHRIMALEEGAKFHQWTIDPEKAQFLEGLEFDYRVLANILGIKVHKLIDSANSSYNSLEMANSEHRDDDLFPWIEQWLGEYNDKMLTENQRDGMTHTIGIDDEYLDGWVPYLDRVRGVTEAKNNDLITRDEARRRINFGPSKDKNAKRFTIPMNIEFTDEKSARMEMMQAAANAAPIRPEDDTPENDDPEDDGDDDNEDGTETDERAGDSESADGVLQGSTEVEPDAAATENNGPSTEAAAFATLRDAWLGKISCRIGKQAVKQSTDTTKFISWVDEMRTETSPEPIQADVDLLCGKLKSRLLEIIDSPLENQTLSQAVAAEVELWNQENE